MREDVPRSKTRARGPFLSLVVGIVFFLSNWLGSVYILCCGPSGIEFCKILNSGLRQFGGELKCQSYIDFRFVSRYHELVVSVF